MAYKKNFHKKEHSFKIIGRDLKEGRIKSPVLLYGKEQYLVNWACGLIASRYIEPATKQLDYTVIDLPEDMAGDNILRSCETLPILSSKRVVVVRDFGRFKDSVVKGFGSNYQERLIEYMSHMDQGTMLIFTCDEVKPKSAMYKAVAGCGSIYEFGTLDSSSLNAFIGKRLKVANADISKPALLKFVNECGYFQKESDYTIYNIENDLTKLIAHCNNNFIELDDIDAVIWERPEYNIFLMIEAISKNRKDDAFKYLHTMLRGGANARYLTTMIAGQFEGILFIRELKDNGYSALQIQKELNMNEYRFKKLMPMTDRYTVRELKNILINVYEIEGNIHGGLLEEEMAFEIFIAGL